MKLILEQAVPLDGYSIEYLNEATGTKKKTYFVEGIFSTANVQNANKRIYPASIWAREVQRYQNVIKNNGMESLGEWQHPPRTTIDPMKAVIKIVELRMEGDYVYGKAKLLDNPEADRLKNLIDEGIKIGISSRGVGSVSNNGIVEDFKLITYDLVDNPSNPGSYLNGISESLIVENGIIQDYEYNISENGVIEEVKICTKTKCTMVDKSLVQEASKSKFKDLFKSLSSVNEVETEVEDQPKYFKIIHKVGSLVAKKFLVSIETKKALTKLVSAIEDIVKDVKPEDKEQAINDILYSIIDYVKTNLIK